MNKNYFGVIMAGGVGARFWPLSRNSRPKQFIDILGTGKTLIQQTFNRLKVICPTENILVVTHRDYRQQVLEQLPEILPGNVLCEPMRRNTAPCIAYATYKIKKLNPDACMVVAPSDHIILKEDVFTETVLTALKTANNNEWLLTLGITPSRPDTGYGYIQFDDEKTYPPDNKVNKVKTFTEKPTREVAESFINSGDFLWNAGIFIWSVKSILGGLKKYQPEINKVFEEGWNSYFTENEDTFIDQAYASCKSISIDFGLMEKAGNVYVIAADMGWSDLGTWGSLFENSTKNKDKNVIIGPKLLAYDTTNTIIAMPDGKLAVVQGLDDYIIVEDNGILLICRRQDEQNIRKFVEDVKSQIDEKFV